MREDIKIRWIDKLLEGRTPAHFTLKDINGNVCHLGALCEIAVEDGIMSWNEREEGGVQASGRHENGHTWYHVGDLPLQVSEWAGLTHRNPVIEGLHVSEWNDKFKLSPEDMANKIKNDPDL